MGQLEEIQKQNLKLGEILNELKRITHILAPIERAKKIEFGISKQTQDGQEVVGGEMKNLEINENGVVAISGFTDAKGNAAKVDGDKVDWSLVAGSEAFGSLEVSADGLSCKFLRNGAVGLAQVNMVADADLTSEKSEIFGMAEFNCLSGKAVKIEFSESSEAQP